MKLCIETMVQIIGLSLCCLFMLELVYVNRYIQQGQNILYQAVNSVECAESWEEAVEDCVEDAGKSGYKLEWKTLETNSYENCMLLTLHYQIYWFSTDLISGSFQAYARG